MRSLAVRMRKRLGDWFKVIQLLKTGSGGNDAEMEEAYNEVAINLTEFILEAFLTWIFSSFFQIGHYFAERHKWDEAVQYYEKASNTEKLVECYYLLEDYDNLENLIDLLQPNDPLLVSMGQMFASVGMGKQSVEAYLKCNKISSAIGKVLISKFSK